MAIHVAILTGGQLSDGNHLTPTELAREAGLERRDVIKKCMEMGVPIFHGRIDKTLFLASLERAGAIAAASRHLVTG